MSPVLQGLGWKLLAARKLRPAAWLLRAAIAFDPANPEAWLIYGHCLKERRRLKEAEAAYRMARRRGYGDAECDFQIGQVATMTGNRAKALRVYRLLADNEHYASSIAELFLTGLLAHDPLRGPEAVGFRSDPPGSEPGAVLYDVTDLTDHAVRTNTGTYTVTGIQRVQFELLGRTVAGTDAGKSTTGYVFFHPVALRFVLVDPQRLFDLANGRITAGTTRFETQVAMMEDGASCEGLQNACLVNLGVPANPAYFGEVSRMRGRNGWKQVSLVHDCLPLTNPEYFDQLTADRFRSFIRQSAACTDLFLTSTQATRRRLIDALKAEGRADPNISVVPFGSNNTVPPQPGADELALERLGLAGTEYVLFVSTLEIRKNHRLALECWKALAQRHGPGAVPQLLLVGRMGWMVEDLVRELGELDVDKVPVRHLQGIGDDDLNVLYRNCVFTLYPSLAEGWGLPVTESLSWSKPVLASSLEVICEAGGDLIDYADPRSLESFIEVAELLLFDPGYRASREARIASNYVRRTWSDVARDIDRVVRTN
ncbi:glycosyltransferase [Hoeflea sp.]|uniref:glycosyltransferase family 4 protein n=1 Tax=Hoeflea sp. TaxID=1940281 RepID=UPI00199E522E|nr:glycosyltransferase [Hoeflea sp.]MBC7285050.1 glycosyltransferase [Hoeflea sp.]